MNSDDRPIRMMWMDCSWNKKCVILGIRNVLLKLLISHIDIIGENLIKKIIYPVMGFLMLVVAGCDEADKPETYVFDLPQMKLDSEKNFMCLMSAVVLSKEVMNAIRDGKKLDGFPKNPTPTTINLYKEKVVWTDLGSEYKIKDDKFTLALGKDSIPYTLIRDTNKISLSSPLKDDSAICNYPFKKVNK